MPETIAAPELGEPPSASALRAIDRYWRAANYLSVGQIYLLENPLLREPLTLDHIKPRLLGHWGTTPGLNFVYAHLNRIIRERDLDIVNVTGPGHGGPGIVANAYLEGTYSEYYPDITPDAAGMQKLFKQFSFPGGIPSHAAPETPGSINEGGELGYSLSHAYGIAFDNPDTVVACVIGDGEAETGPLATSWHGNKFLDPIRDGAVLPILHLNGFKIANPTILARITHAELEALMIGYGYTPHFVEGDDPETMHRLMAATLDAVFDEIAAIKNHAREASDSTRPRWPMIVLRTPKGWTGPKTVDGKKTEGSWRSHQVPLAGLATNPEHVAQLERWMRSYDPEDLFDADGTLRAELRALPPRGTRRMSDNPHANGGRLLRALNLPDFRDYAAPVAKPGSTFAESTRIFGRGGARGRRLFSLARRPRDGDLERTHVPRVARGLPPERATRILLVLRSVRTHRRFDVQPAREMARAEPAGWVARAGCVAQLSLELARLAPGPQWILASGSGVHRCRRQQEGDRRARLPPAGCEHATFDGRPLLAKQELRQRDRCGKAARTAVPGHGGGGAPLREGHRHLGVGEQRRRRTRSRDGMCRRRANA